MKNANTVSITIMMIKIKITAEIDQNLRGQILADLAVPSQQTKITISKWSGSFK